MKYPKYPWRLDTNQRYRELVSTLMNLSTATLLLPVFLARDFFGIPASEALRGVLPCATYWAWASLGLSVLAGIIYHYFSAKWIRLAWDQKVNLLYIIPITESFVERTLEISLSMCVLGFLVGIGVTLVAFV